ncbi:MAG: nuclear transport factor 2 family protein, partial [Reyranella sp.]
MHRRTLLAGLPLLALPPEALAHPPRQPDSAEAKKFIQEVTDFRTKLAKAVLAKDFAALRPLYADSFTHTHGSGKLDNKDARLVSAMAGEPLIEAAPATELSFRVFAGPTV